MPHIELERLAAFDHDLFTDDERAHLTACAVCRRELEAMNRLLAHAAEMAREPRMTPPPLTTFNAIMDRARPTPVRGSVVGSRWWSAARRVAAALVLVVGGVVIGRSMDGGARMEASTPSRSIARADDTPLTITSATALLDRAQRDYERAALWLAANDSVPQSSDVYRARLAALDRMMAASRAALRDAPQDPLLNHYFLSAWAAREATLQQLGAALPVDKLVERY